MHQQHMVDIRGDDVRLGHRAHVTRPAHEGAVAVQHMLHPLARIVDQLGEQIAQVPVEQDTADIENDALANHRASGHAKAPPEASDGVTLTRKCAGTRGPGKAFSPGAP